MTSKTQRLEETSCIDRANKSCRMVMADGTLPPMPENSLFSPLPVVRLIVVDPSGRVLLLRRASGTTAGRLWCLPGGKIDYGDTVERAAVRELQEETGLCAASVRFLFYQDSLPPAPGAMHCINLYLECTAEGDLAVNDESLEAAWIRPEDLSGYQIAFRNDEGLIRYWSDRAGDRRT